jgi:hypothetical protein
MKSAWICLLLLAPVLPALAQDEGSALDRIEVTGSRITYRDLLETPAVSITRPGDYLLQEFRLENDTRDKAGRERELHETIARLVAAGGDRYSLLHGDAYRVTLGRGNLKVPLEEDGKRPDTSRVILQLRADLGADPRQAEAIAAGMQEFLREAATVGRTEVELVDDTALGMARPERYRYELVSAISQDTGRVVQALGLQCSVELDGLNSRIEWQRVSAGELLLYIPYTMTIGGCVGRGS